MTKPSVFSMSLIAGCLPPLFVAEMSLRSLAPFTWNTAKERPFCLVAKYGRHRAYANENSDNDNQKATSERGVSFKKSPKTILSRNYF